MAFSDVGALISDSNNTSGNAWGTTATLARTLNVGQLGVVILATDNVENIDLPASTYSLTDSVGNLWYKTKGFINSQGGAGGGAGVVVFWTICTVQIPTNGSLLVTINNGNITAKNMVGRVFNIASTTGFIACDSHGTRADDGVDAGSMTLSGLSSVERLYLRAIGAETAVTTNTPTSGFTAMTGPGSGSGNMIAKGEFKIATSTGETSDPTTNAVDQASVFVALREIARADAPMPKFLLGGYSNVNTSPWVMGAFTARSGYQHFICVLNEQGSGSVGTPTISGYTQVATRVNAANLIRITLFKALGTGSPVTPSIAIGFVQTRIGWLVHEFEGAADVVQSVTAAASTATLATFAKTNNLAVAYGWTLGNSTAGGAQGDDGWTDIGERLMFEVTFNTFNAICRFDGTDLTPSIGSAALFIAVELAAVSSRSAALSANATLACAAVAVRAPKTATLSLSAHATVNQARQRLRRATVTPSAHATVAQPRQRVRRLAPAISARATVALAAVQVRIATVAISARATVVMVKQRVRRLAPALSARATFAASTARQRGRGAAISAFAAMAGSAVRVRHALTGVSAQAITEVAAVRGRSAAIAMSANAELAQASERIRSFTVAVSAFAGVAAAFEFVGVGVHVVVRSVALSARAEVAFPAHRTRALAADLAASASASVAPTRARCSSATLAARAELAEVATRVRTFSADIAGRATLATLAARSRARGAQLTARAQVAAARRRVRTFSADLAARAVTHAVACRSKLAAVALAAGGQLATAALRFRTASIGASGTANLHVVLARSQGALSLRAGATLGAGQIRVRMASIGLPATAAVGCRSARVRGTSAAFSATAALGVGVRFGQPLTALVMATLARVDGRTGTLARSDDLTATLDRMAPLAIAITRGGELSAELAREGALSCHLRKVL